MGAALGGSGWPLPAGCRFCSSSWSSSASNEPRAPQGPSLAPFSMVLFHGDPCFMGILCLWSCSMVLAPYSCSVQVPAPWSMLCGLAPFRSQFHGGPCSMGVPTSWSCFMAVPAPWGSFLQGPALCGFMLCGPASFRSLLHVGPCSMGALLHDTPLGTTRASPKPPSLLPASAHSQQLHFGVTPWLPLLPSSISPNTAPMSWVGELRAPTPEHPLQALVKVLDGTGSPIIGSPILGPFGGPSMEGFLMLLRASPGWLVPPKPSSDAITHRLEPAI